MRSLPLLAALFLPALLSAAEGLSGRKPNIVFILTDDQGWADVSCHGNPVLKTPHMDRLHREGVRLEDFMVSPTCAPTRSALLTGRHEFANGITHTILERERLVPGAVTLPEVLRTAGYTSGIFGKWHLGDEPEYWPTRRGFDEMFIHGAGGIGQTYAGSCGDAPGNSYFDPVILHNGTFVKTTGYCTDVFFDRALAWMQKQKGGQPFYCHIATNAPHGPLHPRPEDEARYAGKVPPDVAKFYGMIANIDDNIGKLLAKLAEWGIEKDTLVIFMNDNGSAHGSQQFSGGMRGAKGSPWLGGVRVNSFWRWPGTLAPADVNALTAHIDFFPTLSELAGATLPDAARAQIAGRSLVPLLADPKAAWADRKLFTHVGRWPKGEDPEPHRMSNTSVRTERWTLVSVGGKRKGGAAEADAWQLFDLEADPGQERNVAADHADVVAELSAAHTAWWKSVRPLMVNEDAPQPPVNTFKKLYWEQFGTAPGKQAKPVR